MAETTGQDEKRIAVTLTHDQAKRLKTLGNDVDLSIGLLSRALIEYGLAHADETGVRDAIQAVRDADRDRRRRVGSRVMTERHNKQKGSQ